MNCSGQPYMCVPSFASLAVLISSTNVVYMLSFAGMSSSIRSYRVYINSSGQPYMRVCPLLHPWLCYSYPAESYSDAVLAVLVIDTKKH